MPPKIIPCRPCDAARRFASASVRVIKKATFAQRMDENDEDTKSVLYCRATSVAVASGYTITAAASPSVANPTIPYKTLADIPISEMFSHDLSAQTAFGIAGGLYVFIKLLEAIKFFSLVGWAWRKVVKV